jgi:hypothetical protein
MIQLVLHLRSMGVRFRANGMRGHSVFGPVLSGNAEGEFAVHVTLSGRQGWLWGDTGSMFL